MKTLPKSIIWILLMLSAVIAFESRGTEAQVENAIKYILQDGIKSRRIAPHRRHKLLKDNGKLESLAQAIYQAAHDHDIPEMLLVAIAFRENSFIGTEKGDLGEESNFQIIPRVARFVRNGSFPWTNYSEPRCDLDTIDGAAMCAAALLWIHRSRCGTLEGAVTLYASGRTCTADKPRLHWLTADRIKIMKILESEFK